MKCETAFVARWQKDGMFGQSGVDREARQVAATCLYASAGGSGSASWVNQPSTSVFTHVHQQMLWHNMVHGRI